jgi:hypothetical protein
MPNTLNTLNATHVTSGRASLPLIDAVNPSERPSQQWQVNGQFVAMLNAYRCSGGLARAQELAVICKSLCETRLIALADWIVKRKVISFEWESKIWLPRFQFNHVDMTLAPGLEDTLAELVVVYDNWQIANWFSLPNLWLADRTPADALAATAPEVLHAARAERHVASR